MMNKIRNRISNDIQNSFKDNNFDDQLAVDLLEKSFKKSVLSFSTFLRENYSTRERWENVQLEDNIWREYGTDEELNGEEIFKKWENEQN